MLRFQFNQLKSKVQEVLRSHCIAIADDSWIIVPNEESSAYRFVYFQVLEGTGEKLVLDAHITLGIQLKKLRPICYGYSPAVWCAMHPMNEYKGPPEKRNDLWFGL